jgi:cardiolipin synthase
MKKSITLATKVTILRIVLTPVIVYTIIMHQWLAVLLLFLCAALTDAIDGFLARYFDEKTFLGACLDPVADKILLLSTFFTLYYINTIVFHIPIWFICLFVGKELLQICGALLLYKKCGWIAIEANKWGKVTTLIQIVFIIWLFCSYFYVFLYNGNIYYGFLAIMSLLMMISFVRYTTIWMHLLQTGVPNLVRPEFFCSYKKVSKDEK